MVKYFIKYNGQWQNNFPTLFLPNTKMSIQLENARDIYGLFNENDGDFENLFYLMVDEEIFYFYKTEYLDFCKTQEDYDKYLEKINKMKAFI